MQDLGRHTFSKSANSFKKKGKKYILMHCQTESITLRIQDWVDQKIWLFSPSNPLEFLRSDMGQLCSKWSSLQPPATKPLPRKPNATPPINYKTFYWKLFALSVRSLQGTCRGKKNLCFNEEPFLKKNKNKNLNLPATMLSMEEFLY